MEDCKSSSWMVCCNPRSSRQGSSLLSNMLVEKAHDGHDAHSQAAFKAKDQHAELTEQLCPVICTTVACAAAHGP